MNKVKLLYYSKLFFELIGGVCSIILISLIGTYFLKLLPYDDDILRYIILGIFVFLMILILIAIYILRNFQLIINSTRIYILGISMFMITELLRTSDSRVEKLFQIYVPTTVVVCGISILCIFLYFSKIEKAVFDKEFIENNQLEVDLESPEVIKQSIQDNIAKWIKKDLKGKIGITTEDIILSRKRGRQAIVGIYLTDKEVPVRLFEIPVNL